MSADPPFLLHRLFEEQVRRSPEATALLEAGRSVTFDELDELSTRVADSICARGVSSGDLVGLHMDRSIEWVVSTLGIFKANAAVVPLPPAFPEARLEKMLDHASLALVIDSDTTPLRATSQTAAINISELVSPRSEMTRPAGHDHAPLAFVLCSSGSTGLPKMIARSHSSFRHRLSWTWEEHPYDDGEVCCQKAQVTTTHSIYELFEPLLRGVPVVIIPEEDARNLETFWDVIAERRISRLLIVPSALHASLEIPDFKAPPLKHIVIMGEYLDSALAGRTIKVFESANIYSIYGSTEASSVLLCDVRSSWRQNEELPLGVPIRPDISALVLNAELQPVSADESGQLHIAGPALFEGYLGDPGLTDSVLVSVPGRSGKVYDTRDRVRLTMSGELAFVGRIDDTVKIRGFRVDLQEVQNALLAHSDVSRAAVLVDDQPAGSGAMLAFVTPSTCHPANVLSALREQLPDYMIPSALRSLDQFPSLANSKLDRKALLSEYRQGKSGPTTNHALSETETLLSTAWIHVLDQSGFDAGSNFFESGGTSLTVFSLVNRIRQDFELSKEQFSAQSVYRNPILSGLAQEIDEIRAGTREVEVGPTPLLVCLRKGSAPQLSPFFLIASAGGTLGAYEKLVKKLSTEREVIGVRDPYIWNERDPTESFQEWVARYVEAIRERQPHGPYYIGAYSSAGSFGCEIARRLSVDGDEIRLLALVDPLALDCSNRHRFGWWALRATYSHPLQRLLVRAAGRLRTWLPRRPDGNPDENGSARLSPKQFQELAARQTGNKHEIKLLASLIELNTGLPFSLDEPDFSGESPDRFLRALTQKFERLMPDVEPDMVERILIQYPLQVKAQHAYELQCFDGPAHLFEPLSQYAGLSRSLLRPYMPNLAASILEIGPPTAPVGAAVLDFGALDPHYRSMRDDVFVGRLATELDALLQAEA